MEITPCSMVNTLRGIDDWFADTFSLSGTVFNSHQHHTDSLVSKPQKYMALSARQTISPTPSSAGNDVLVEVLTGCILIENGKETSYDYGKKLRSAQASSAAPARQRPPAAGRQEQQEITGKKWTSPYFFSSRWSLLLVVLIVVLVIVFTGGNKGKKGAFRQQRFLLASRFLAVPGLDCSSPASQVSAASTRSPPPKEKDVQFLEVENWTPCSV